MRVSDESVEALAKRNFESEQGDGEWAHCPVRAKPGWIKEARAQAEAVAPFIAAQTLEDAADEWDELPMNRGAEIKTGTWDWFELFPLLHMRDRAEAIRKSA